MIASANLLGTALGVIGSLIQARFVSPDELGFLRKYSVVSSYAIFLSFGLFTILQREYPVLMGRGETERARRVAAIGQTWCLTATVAVCAGLTIVCLLELFRGNWREACAWFIQIVSVASILYGGYLTCTFRSGHDFERLAKSSFLSSIVGTLVLPLFAIWPFATLVLRSVAGSMVSTTYLHAARPVRVSWCLPLGEFRDLTRRGIRLFVGTYLRYNFWLSVEIWLMLLVAGDVGVGLFVFSSMISMAVGQLATAINQVYTPRLAQLYGQTGSLGACLRLSLKPTIANILFALFLSGAAWLALPPILTFAFPKYVPAIPLVKVLLLDTIVVSLSLPVYMVPVLEDYITQIVAAIVGLAFLFGIAFYLHSFGIRELSVVWGTIAGRFVFVAVSLASLGMRLKRT